MSVYDFVSLLVDDSMELTIYDNNSGENLWTGEASEVPDEYEEFEIDAIDPPEKPWSMTISISYDEEQED